MPADSVNLWHFANFDFDIIKIVLVIDIIYNGNTVVDFDIKKIVLVIEKNKSHKSSFGNS